MSIPHLVGKLRRRLSERYPHRDFPALGEPHLRGAKLYASRNDLIADLRFLRRGTIAEVGVALGDFSEFIIRTLAPKKFVAFDNFEMDNWLRVWGAPHTIAFKGLTHIEFYRARFASHGDLVRVEHGLLRETLVRYPAKMFDMIYIDADHSYEGVKRDAELSKTRIKDDGVLIFNDYIMYDHVSRVPCGVVQTVNELVVAENWKVIGFALHHELFCDIAIQRQR